MNGAYLLPIMTVTMMGTAPAWKKWNYCIIVFKILKTIIFQKDKKSIMWTLRNEKLMTLAPWLTQLPDTCPGKENWGRAWHKLWTEEMYLRNQINQSSQNSQDRVWEGGKPNREQSLKICRYLCSYSAEYWSAYIYEERTHSKEKKHTMQAIVLVPTSQTKKPDNSPSLGQRTQRLIFFPLKKKNVLRRFIEI